MKIEFNYGKKLAVIPFSAFDHLERASKLDIKVLFLLSSGEDDLSEIADKLAATEEKVISAVGFWKKAGVFDTESAPEPKKAEEKKSNTSTAVRRSDDLPAYTTEELSKILEKRAEASGLVDEAQRIVGRMFNSHDLNVILGFMDYLGLDYDYIMALLMYCASIGKKSLSYAEKLAFRFHDEGIDSVEALNEKIAELELVASNEGKVRTLFGMKQRALTAKEKKYITLWFSKYGYDIDVITRAYEITVANTNEASVDYAHAILTRWNDEGMKTLEAIDKSIEDRKAQKSGETEASFDTEDFFEAALKRSYKKTE